MENYKIIDFHTHPFLTEKENICSHKNNVKMDLDFTIKLFDSLGVEKFCGSVLNPKGYHGKWEDVKTLNESALKIAQTTDKYIPGIHVHPQFVKESIAEIEKYHKLGVRLIGELCPYMQGWSDYSDSRFYEILECAEQYNMVVSIHSMGEDQMDALVKRFPNLAIVAAHPGEYNEFCRHLQRMSLSENYYLDLSGYGIFRFGMLRHALDEFGKERFLFGSDYPTCNLAMYVGGVTLDDTISETEKNAILYENAKRLLKL